MRGRRHLGAWTAGIVLTGLVGGVTASAGPAAAAATSVTCTSLSGNLSASPITFTLGGCTGNTGGGGTVQGETIIWRRGGISYLSTAAFTPTGPTKHGKCPSLSDRYVVHDTVVGDSTGSLKVGGSLSADVCIVNEVPDAWSLAPGSVLKIR